MTGEELAITTVRFLRSAKNNDSAEPIQRFFNLKKPHTILRDELINNFMMYAKNSNTAKNLSPNDWKQNILDLVNGHRQIGNIVH